MHTYCGSDSMRSDCLSMRKRKLNVCAHTAHHVDGSFNTRSHYQSLKRVSLVLGCSLQRCVTVESKKLSFDEQVMKNEGAAQSRAEYGVTLCVLRPGDKIYKVGLL